MTPIDPAVHGILQSGVVQKRQADRQSRLRAEQAEAEAKVKQTIEHKAVEAAEASEATLDTLTHSHESPQDENDLPHVDVKA
ncbi:MAG: hypothetical protein AAF743_11805 [Planctomycetota bacterium]